MDTTQPNTRQRSLHSSYPDSCGMACRSCEPTHSPSLTVNSNSVDDELISYHVEPGFGIFDSGATGHAISVHELDHLRAEDPDASTEVDEARRKVMGLGGGTQTRSLGVCTHNPTVGPMSHKPIEWDVSNNTHSNTPDKCHHSFRLHGPGRTRQSLISTPASSFSMMTRTMCTQQKLADRRMDRLETSYWLLPLTAKACQQAKTERFEDLPSNQKAVFSSILDSYSYTHDNPPIHIPELPNAEKLKFSFRASTQPMRNGSCSAITGWTVDIRHRTKR